MVQNSLGSTVRWILLVCSLFLMFSQQPHAEQHAILVGVWDYENPNLQLGRSTERFEVDGGSPLRARRRTGTDAYPDQSE